MTTLKRVCGSLLHIILLLVLSSIPVGAQSAQYDFSALENVIREELKETNTPGAAISIVSGERVVFAKG